MLKIITIQDAINSSKNQHTSSAYAIIRTRARSVAKQAKWKTCINCGYSKHIEIAHIKPINEFPTTTKISIVNKIDNLLALCRNCHWEFDNGLLDLNGLSRPSVSFKKCGCGISLTFGSHQCRECYYKNKHSIDNRISKTELEKLIKSKPISHISKEFGVSDSAIIKWCKHHGITRPGRGYWSGKS